MTEPVMYLASSEARKTAAEATSSAEPNRLKEICFSISCLFFKLLVMSVSIKPGAITLQVTFLRPNSLAIDLDNPIIPALEAA